MAASATCVARTEKDTTPLAPETKGEELVRMRRVSGPLEAVVVSDIDLVVHRGEVVTLIGPNGAGKSTILRLLLGLQKVSAGEVWRKPKLRIGYLPQLTVFNPSLPLTVKDWLCLPTVVADHKLQEALSQAGVAISAKQLLRELSGGELQRVMLARALLCKPDLLVLDEPVQKMDIHGQAEFYNQLNKLRYSLKCGVLMVSHDLHMVMFSTDQVLCIQGHVCCSGAPEAISRDPTYEKIFGKAFAPYIHQHDHTHSNR